MEDKKEIQIASKLGDYVDGKEDVSGAEWTDVKGDIETVNLLRLGLGEEVAANEVFSRRLRDDLVEEAGRQRRRAAVPRWALVAASVLLLLASGLLVQRGVREMKVAPEGGREIASGESALRTAPAEEAALRPAAPLTESRDIEYRMAAFSDDNGAAFRMEPFSGASEVRIERVTVRWRESRMEAVYERYMIERGGE